jgi:3-dehydroquinate dehydratase
MLTRLDYLYSSYKQASQKRSVMLVSHHMCNQTPPLEDRIDALSSMYKAKIAYAKMYHGAGFQKQFDHVNTLQRDYYLNCLRYQQEPTDTTWRKMVRLEVGITAAKRRLFGKTYES